MKASLFWLPRAVATAKPAPYSKAVTAGSDNSALARSALSLSKTGSPSPAGTPTAINSLTPPIESWSLRTSSINSIMRAAVSGSGQRTGVDSTCSRVTAVGSGTSAMCWPTCLT